MKRKVFLLLAVCTMLLVCSTAFCDGLMDQFNAFDKQTHLQICGANDTNVVTSGPLYDRFKAVVTKLEYTQPIYLVRNGAFNACASSSEAFIFSGLLEKDPSDNQLALVIAHEITHIKNNDLWEIAQKKMVMYREVERAAAAVNKPGYEENAQSVLKYGPMVVDIFSLRYSREMEEKADIGGIKKIIDKGFDAQDALGLFDQIPSGPSGILAMLSSHPDSQKRKVYTAETITQNVPRETIESAIKGIVCQCEPPEFAKAAGKDYTGFSSASVEKFLTLLVKNDGNAIKAGRRGNKLCREAFVTLSPEVKKVTFLLTNPKSDRFLRFGRIFFGSDSSSPEHWGSYLTLVPKYVTMTIPVEALLINDSIEVTMLFGTKPIHAGPDGKLIPNDNDGTFFTIKFHFNLAK